ncbi:MAG: SDR family NAD(P)-dependent oxidoreductase [Myxococcales bacterium]|nr:SDR family NAD(P)-dependent oxidoreductase [Myxococcales bacterium]
MARDLTNKVVVLTGASRGIGRAVAVDLAREGARLVLAARDEQSLVEVAREVRAVDAEAHVVRCDVTSDADRRALVERAEAIGPVEVLINNAGIEYPISVLDHDAAQIEQQIAVNLTAPLMLTRLVLPSMVERNEGAIVTVSSMSGKSPTPYNAIYSATKYGVNGFTASLRIELRDTKVHAGVVCPSFVAEAGMWADTGLKAPAMVREVPLQRVVAGVRACIDGKAEVLVTPSPMRPLLALGQLFPGLDETMLSRLGVTEILQSRAEGAKSSEPEA